MFSKKGDETSMATVAIVIIIIIAIAAILIFAFSVSSKGKEQAETQANIGSNIADIANCRLFADGMLDKSKFPCICPQDILDNAAKKGIDVSSCRTS
jgi:uncharacterized membrane protein